MIFKKVIATVFMILALTTPAFAQEPVTENVNYESLVRVSDKSPEELAEYMHPETAHLAEEVVEICAEYGVNAEFIAAVMRYERCPGLCNWFGWSDGSGLIAFDSDILCLETVIPKIRENYLEPDGCYYNGATVEGVSVRYNNTDFWRETISEEMERMI